MMAASMEEAKTSGTPKVKASKATTVRLVDAAGLAAFEEKWSQLALNAIAPNVFYEPWILLPAIKYLAEDRDIRFLLVFGPAVKEGREPLWGLFPLEVKTKCLEIPLRTMSFWQHDYCFLTVPLVDRGRVWEALGAFWEWFERNPLSCRVLDTNHLPADGPFHHAWSELALGRVAFMLSDYPRAALTPSQDGADAYIANLVTRKHHDEFRRLERRLAETGELRYHRVSRPDEIQGFIERFVEIEAGGWKGTAGAFARRDGDVQFLRDITHEGFRNGRVMLLALSLNGRHIALKHNLMTSDGVFTFKITFDETFAKYSPGLLLEIENIREAHRDTRIKWMDSCATPRHPMANRIWGERRMIRRTLLSDGSRSGDLVLSALPMLRWIKRLVKPSDSPRYLQVSTKQH